MSEGTRSGRVGDPVDRLETDGWSLAEESAETLFSLPGVHVEGHTRIYEDAALRRAVREISGVDQVSRFFFVAVVEISPSLSPGAAPLIEPTVASQARREFAADLRGRGFTDVDRGRTRTLRIDAGVRARLTDYRARYSLRTDSVSADLRIRGFLAVWWDGGFRIAGGAYPESGLEDLLTDADVEPDGNAYREELLALIRAVE